MAITIDSGFPRHVFLALAPTSSSITSITTAGPSFMVAVLHIDNPAGVPTVTATGGLTWTERAHESAVGDTGHWVSVWTAPSAGALSAVTITFSYTGSNAAELDIYSLHGTSNTVGATATQDSNTTVAVPQVTINALAANSMIIGGLDNYATGGTLTPLANTTVDANDSTTDEIASGHAFTTGAGNITVGGSAPSFANCCCAVIEVKAAGGTSFIAEDDSWTAQTMQEEMVVSVFYG